MRRDEKIQLLLAYCRQRGQLERLALLLQQAILELGIPGDMVRRALRGQAEPATAQVIWDILGEERPVRPRLLRASAALVDEWIQSPEFGPFRESLFQTEQRFARFMAQRNWPALDELEDQASLALFADRGVDRDPSRQRLQKRLAALANVLVLSHDDFRDLLRLDRVIRTEDHLAVLFQLANGRISGIAIPDWVGGPVDVDDAVRQLVRQIQAHDYTWVCVIVDNVDGFPEPQRDIAVALNLISPLIGDCALWDAPDLYLKLFLPLALEEHVKEFAAFRAEQIVRLRWMPDDLLDLLRDCLAQATAFAIPGRPIDTLQAFIDRSPAVAFRPRDLDQAVVTLAQGSPRRLAKIVRLLFQHRAAQWDQAGRDPEQLFVRTVDWATLLEWLWQRDGEI
ncbi:MAG: hypothetical protein KKA73_05115 [Chloroflexi bacterium]|nr:hypothetical protein [Chloroflexota bacterium]MBU1747048.1 hypothetical protein [Chloroflexota bacterium]